MLKLKEIRHCKSARLLKEPILRQILVEHDQSSLVYHLCILFKRCVQGFFKDWLKGTPKNLMRPGFLAQRSN